MDNHKLFVFLQSYSSSNAVSNRIHAMVKAFVENGLQVKVIPVGIAVSSFPMVNGVIFEEIRHWKKHVKKADYYFQYLFSQAKLKKYIKTIPNNATVVLMGCRDYLHLFTKRTDLKIFQEVTEHHSVVRTFRVSRYIKNCKKLDGVFVISTALKLFYQSIGIPEEHIHIINMFVDENRFTGLKKEAVEKPYIAYCGNMSNTKDGVDLLLEAYSKIADKTDLDLMLIGKYNGGMDSFINEHHLEKRVRFTGLVNYKQIPQLLMNASVLALARPDSIQAKNGFPTKLGEYLLTGNPVVITKVGDIPLFLEHKKSALLSDSCDMDIFASNLLWAIEHPVEAQVIGARGREVALNNFNYHIETKKMVAAMFGD